MKNKETIKKLRECAKGLLEVARELQSSERMEPPRTLEIVERQIRAKDGKAHGFQLPFAVGMDEFGEDVVLELARLPHVLIGGATGQGKTMCLNSLIAGLVATKMGGSGKSFVAKALLCPMEKSTPLWTRPPKSLAK